ncbi:hypothetical protein [Aliarcobacter butzleri]|uniref:hypothetical protein n=1 Tax=Aliarcobacter butzleri TaxID=28197 RepID=UPI003AF4DBFD
MQIIIGIAIFIVIITVLIYKINDRFEKKEFIIFLLITIFTTIGFIWYEKSQEGFFPKMFKVKYEKENNVLIEGLEYELLNNKVVTSKDKFIYKFTYLVKKDNKEFLCTVNNVEINKIQKEFIFKDFGNLQEECIEK